jgi:hypothetical protein
MRLVVMWQSRLETVLATPALFEHLAQCRQHATDPQLLPLRSPVWCVAALLRPNRSRRLAFYGTLLQCLSVRLARPVPVLLGLGFDGTARQAARRQLGWGAPWSRPGRAPTTGQLQLFGDDGIKSRAAPPQSLTEKARERGIGTSGETSLRETEREREWGGALPVHV